MLCVIVLLYLSDFSSIFFLENICFLLFHRHGSVNKCVFIKAKIDAMFVYICTYIVSILFVMLKTHIKMMIGSFSSYTLAIFWIRGIFFLIILCALLLLFSFTFLLVSFWRKTMKFKNEVVCYVYQLTHTELT